MKIKDIEKEIGTLSNPSKMPAYAWGISAKQCKVGSKLAKIKGTICNSRRRVRKSRFDAACKVLQYRKYTIYIATAKVKNSRFHLRV